MKYTFCTLFDSYYLDKAFALIYSMQQNIKEFEIYMFCFDEKSYDVLKKENFQGVIPVLYKQIETEKLLELKKERSKAEYCWTCTPVIIEYVLDVYKAESCTYIDADMYFFGEPENVFAEIKRKNADVAIVEHRFPDTEEGRNCLNKSGRFCVEFNYFNNTENSRKILNWWKEQCLDWCYYHLRRRTHGDQKYLEKFPVLFENVCIVDDLGIGVAPWNLGQYALKENNSKIILKEQDTNKDFELILYHFQGLRFISEDKVNVGSGTKSKELKQAVYYPYLKAIMNARQTLQKYGLTFQLNFSKTNNKLIAFLQKHVRQYKVQSLSDIMSLKKIK